MEAIRFIWNWIDYLLIVIPSSAAVMIAYQSLRRIFAASNNDVDVMEDCKKKIQHTIIGSIIAMTISATISLIKNYFI